MAALLRLAAMLVSNAVHPLRMLLTLLPRACHTDVERDRLPAMEHGNHTKEETAAATNSQPMKTLTLFVSPLIPAKAGTQGSPRSLFRREAAAQNQSKPPGLSWIPAFAGTSGEKLLATPRS
jgi:hypothetical protein